MEAKKGLLVSVLRASHDGSNGGITATVSQFILVGEGVPEIFSASEDTPELLLVRRGDRLHAVPSDRPFGRFTGPMFGGNFIFSSDGRFPSRQPIAVHDRYETTEQYEELSR